MSAGAFVKINNVCVRPEEVALVCASNEMRKGVDGKYYTQDLVSIWLRGHSEPIKLETINAESAAHLVKAIANV